MRTKISILTLFICFAFFSSKETKKETINGTNATTEKAHKGQSAVVDEDSEPNALQVAASLEDFKTLVVAVKAADLENTLVNAGPLTVFAPVNGAFDKLPEGTVATLLKPENKSKLSFILKKSCCSSKLYCCYFREKRTKKQKTLYGIWRIFRSY